MNYAPLVKAIQEGDQKAANRLIEQARPVLVRMLMARMNASQEDAEDAVQKMFLYVIEAIQEDRIENPTGFLSYMIITCRHNYLKARNGLSFTPLDDLIHEPSESPDQVDRLMSEDQYRILTECLEQLSEENRQIFSYWLQKPEASAIDVSERFGISKSNAWTKKHRILNKVRKCFKSKLDLA